MKVTTQDLILGGCILAGLLDRRHLLRIAWKVSQSLVVSTPFFANAISVFCMTASLNCWEAGGNKKRSPDHNWSGGPVTSDGFRSIPDPRGLHRLLPKAGLLTSGSFRTSRLPNPRSVAVPVRHWRCQSPVTAAGPFPICTGFPFKSQGHLRYLICILNRRACQLPTTGDTIPNMSLGTC